MSIPRNTCEACRPHDPCRRCCKRRAALVKKAPAEERRASRQSRARERWTRSMTSDRERVWVHSTEIFLAAKDDAEPTPKGGDILRRVEGRMK